jgi:hypothetical protein
VPGLRSLNAGGFALVASVSCAWAGNCAAGGFYRDRHYHSRVFVVSQRNHAWGNAIEVPGPAALNKGSGGADVFSVSCVRAGTCAAGGYYTDRSGHFRGFVVNRSG